MVLTVLTLRVTCREKREAQTQNCAGSQCSQNNLNLSPSPFNPGLGFGLGAAHGFGPFGGFGLGFGGGASAYGGGLGGHHTQNCLGSQCQQNNQNVAGLGGAHVGHGQTQNCVGSQCQQNNQNLPVFAFGRRKRSAGEGETRLASVSGDKRKNLTVRKIPTLSGGRDDAGGRHKRSAPGGGRRKYTRRVVRTEVQRYQEDDQNEDIISLPSLLSSDQFLDKVINFRYLD